MDKHDKKVLEKILQHIASEKEKLNIVNELFGCISDEHYLEKKQLN